MSNRVKQSSVDSNQPIAVDTIKRRMIVIGVGLMTGLTLATGRAVVLQTVGADDLKREASRNYVRSQTLDGWRGDIVDRNGALLAVTVHRWAVTVDPQHVRDAAHTAAVLAPILDADANDVHRKIDPVSAPSSNDSLIDNPASRAARKASAPMARFLATTFQTPTDRLTRRLDLIDTFYQLNALPRGALFKLVDLLADAAELSAGALHADVSLLRFFPSHGRRFAYLARNVDDETIRRLNDARTQHAKRCREARRDGQRCYNPLAAVMTRPEPRRYYPKREIAAPILGLVGSDSNGLSGIERSMNALLAGGAHTVPTIKDKRGRRMFLDGVPEDAPLTAPSVQLTLDLRIQAVAEHELAKACLSSGSRVGYAVVMRTDTGEILAAANFPNYNPNTFQDWFRDRQPLKDERLVLTQQRRDLEWAKSWSLNRQAYPDQHPVVARENQAALSEQLDAYIEYQHRFPNASRNTAFLDVYEPGSVMKIFTAAAWLEEGLGDLGRVFDLEGGDWQLHDADDNVIHDLSRLREGDLALILKKSSNIGAAKLGFELGSERLHRYLESFGFGAPTQSGFPGEGRGLLRPAAEWVPVELANVSFGQGMAAIGHSIGYRPGRVGQRRPTHASHPHSALAGRRRPDRARMGTESRQASCIRENRAHGHRPDARGGRGRRHWPPRLHS